MVPSTRRQLLAGFAALTAGCIGSGDDPGGGNTPTTTPDPATPTPEPTPPPEPPTIDEVSGEWRSAEHDAGNTRYNSDARGPADEPAQAWTEAIEGVSQFVVADGRVFVRTRTALLALDAATGERLWRGDFPDETDSGPVIHEGNVLIAAGGDLLAVDATTGEREWSVGVPAGGVADLVAREEVVYVGTREGGRDGEPVGYVLALAADDGEKRWQTSTRDLYDPIYPAGVGEIGADEDGVAFVTDDGSGSATANLGLDPSDGSKRWLNSGRNHGGALTVADGTVYTGGFYGGLVAEDVPTGEQRWQAVPGPAVGSIGVDDERVYATTPSGAGVEEARLVALDVDDGEEDWLVPFSRTSAGEFAVGEAVYVASEAGLRALDPDDGEKLWHVDPADLPTVDENEWTGVRQVAVVDEVVYLVHGERVRALA